VDRQWFDTATRDRTDLAASLTWKCSNQKDRSQTSGFWSIAATLGFVYAIYDDIGGGANREYWRILPSLEAAYQFHPNFSLRARIAYTNSDDSLEDRDYQQFIVAPSLLVERKW
jgi:hypothetical protein